MDENKIEEVKEFQEDVNEMKELAETADPSGSHYILAGLAFLLGFGVLFLIAKKFAKKNKAWRQAKKEVKAKKKAQKDAMKHPENYVTDQDIPIDDGDDETETK